MFTILFFLSSGLFLGWSLGANDAANVFGTAVSTKMIRFKSAAIICAFFVIIGAVISGAGTTETLGKLGSVNAIAGAFTVAFSAGFTVFVMTKMKLPVSTSQSIVGAIIGWNVFAGFKTDYSTLTKIVSTWILCPVLSAVFALIIFFIIKKFLYRSRLHMIKLDLYTRLGLILVGAFGSYSLGANNIANVMGVFVPVSPFKNIDFSNIFVLSGTQQLFLLGGIAIAIGVFTYSRRVMETVGSDIFRLSPIDALITVMSSAMVLFIFASQGLQSFLVSHGLPSIPLVPVSSSQAVVGAVLGIAIAKGGKNINHGIIGKISLGWVATPVFSGIITYILLFFMQNVFLQQVFSK
ncbi:MAG: inorganic phosphate transporter [Acidobacteriota bacterium]